MTKRLKPKHLFGLVFVSDPQVNPDGDRVAAVHTTIQQEEDEPPAYHSRIFLYDLRTGETLAFTRGSKSDKSPRFSPDGTKLAFLSARDHKKPQLHVISLSGGEAQRLTSFKAGVSELVWSPDGDRLALISRGDWEDEAEKGGQARTIDRMFYKRDGAGFRPTKPAQIYVYTFDKDKTKGISDLPVDPEGLAFDPGGESLLFSAPENREADDEWQRYLWRLPVKGGKAVRLVWNQTNATSPSPSPDGQHIAFLGPTESGNLAAPPGLWRVGSDGGDAELLSGDVDAAPSAGGDSRHGSYPNTPVWREDSGAVFVNVNTDGQSNLARVGLDGDLKLLSREARVVTSFHYAAKSFAFIAETPDRPGELFYRKGRQEQPLSAANAEWVEKYRLSSPSERQKAKARGGPKVSYWTLPPHKPRKDEAMVLQVHGGPHTNYGYGFYFEFQLLASAGYTVVYGNPRGSSSYGLDFATALLGGYGTVDADDVLAIARSAKGSRADDAPTHLTGGSYGGFMTNWLVGHTDTFRSAVTQRSISNWISFYGTSDIGYRFAEREVAGTPWDDFDKLWEQSPLKYVENITTPLLIIHAEEDHRCPIEQAEQFYIALKRLGKAEIEFLRFPDEGHELSRSGRPDRVVARLAAILEWFETHA